MRAQYIDHSGYYIEGSWHALLFDYYRGALPEPSAGAVLSCFASHHHPDHFTREMFEYGERYSGTRYILGCDISLNAATKSRMGITQDMASRCVRLHRDEEFCADGLYVRALRSTDLGVAFYLECEGKRIFHAGDLNLWLWGEDASFDRAQIERFYFELEMLRGVELDAAFLPLDPRLGEAYWRGFDAFARLLAPRLLVPMHMVDDYAIIERFKALSCTSPYRDRIVDIAPGVSFEL